MNGIPLSQAFPAVTGNTLDDLRRLYEGGGLFAAFDVETTGLESDRDRIVEIGAVRFDRRGMMARYSVLIDPGAPMPPEVTRINNITDAMLKGKPPIEAVLPDFLRFVKGAVLTAHNAPFDIGFINAALKRAFKPAPKPPEGGGLFDAAESPAGFGANASAGAKNGASAKAEAWSAPFPSLPNRAACTLEIAKFLFPGRREAGKNYKLQDMAAELGIKASRAHRACDDARVCMEFFVRILMSRRGA